MNNLINLKCISVGHELFDKKGQRDKKCTHATTYLVCILMGHDVIIVVLYVTFRRDIETERK